MPIESIARVVAGAFVTLSLVGAHLTGFCPLVSILRRLGIGSEGASSRA